MSPMNPADFVTLLEVHLLPRHVPFSRAAVIAFVDACWPLIEDDPDPAFWCDAFLATGDVMAPA